MILRFCLFRVRTKLFSFKKDDVYFGGRISLVDQKVGKFDYSKKINGHKVASSVSGIFTLCV